MKVRTNLFFVVVLGLLALCGPALATDGGDPAQGMISYWQLDEGTGTKAADTVGENHGTIHDANWTTGQVGGALSFDGDRDYVEVPSNPSLDANTATWTFWVNPMGNPDGSGQSPYGTGAIMIRADSWGAWNGVHISLMPHDTYGTIIMQVKSNANPSLLVEDTVFFPPDVDYNTWSHVAFVFDSGNYAELYINGQLAVNYTLGSFSFNNQVLRLATSTDSYFYDFNGLLDEVMIFGRALSAEQLQQIYQAGLNGQAFPVDRIIAINKIENAIDEKLDALESIDAALQKEWVAVKTLNKLLANRQLRDLRKIDIIKARMAIYRSIIRQFRTKIELRRSISELESSLEFLNAN